MRSLALARPDVELRVSHNGRPSRRYKGGETEVISMGLDQMYSDPVGFAKNDPEYFALIHGILSGSARKEKK